MQNLLKTALILAWALWLGGLVALLMFVLRLFEASRPVAVEAAPVLFRTFASYQVLVGMIACAAGTLLAMSTRRRVHAALSLVMIAALSAALLVRGWTHQMESIRHAGQSTGPEFKALHAKTSIAYTGSAGLLLIAGIGYVLTMSTRRTGIETVQARDSQDAIARRSPTVPEPRGHAPPA